MRKSKKADFRGRAAILQNTTDPSIINKFGLKTITILIIILDYRLTSAEFVPKKMKIG
jgi:hypothetical protein